jgi:hypothetical protein
LEHTRKELQELDALLEQMLALPLSQRPGPLEDEPLSSPVPAAPAVVDTTIALTPFVRRPPPLLEKAVPAASERVVTFVPSPTPPPDQEAHVDLLFAAHYPEVNAEVETLIPEGHEPESPVSAVDSLPDPTVVDVRPPENLQLPAHDFLDLVGIPQAESEVWAVPSPGLVHRLLIGIDRCYDLVAGFFWPFHRVLRWSGTKRLLGLLGILLLLGAIGWLLVQPAGWPW